MHVYIPTSDTALLLYFVHVISQQTLQTHVRSFVIKDCNTLLWYNMMGVINEGT